MGALAPADEQAKTVTAEEASTAAPTEVEVATDAPVDAVKMPETMVEEAEPAAPVGQHHVHEKAAPEEAAPVEPKEREEVEQPVEEADVKAIQQSALVDETAPKEETPAEPNTAPAASNTEEPVAKSAVAAEVIRLKRPPIVCGIGERGVSAAISS